MACYLCKNKTNQIIYEVRQTMAIMIIPALAALLEAKEMDSGRELTREDIESIRENATAIELPAEFARDMIKSRGYPDIDADNVWNEWLLYKLLRIRGRIDVLRAEILEIGKRFERGIL